MRANAAVTIALATGVAMLVAIAGSAQSTPLFDSMEILGKDLCRARLRKALDVIPT